MEEYGVQVREARVAGDVWSATAEVEDEIDVQTHVGVHVLLRESIKQHLSIMNI